MVTQDKIGLGLKSLREKANVALIVEKMIESCLRWFGRVDKTHRSCSKEGRLDG